MQIAVLFCRFMQPHP